jgi:hypothetical protein
VASDPEPRKPFSIMDSAIALHEFYTNLMQAGFTAEQALYLTAQAILGGKSA